MVSLTSKNILKGALLLSSTVAYGQTSGAGSTKPDVLFIITDDQTFDAIAALGNSDIVTPNLDRLVRMGTTFTNTYIMGGWNDAPSIASRSQLITGRYLWNSKKDQDNGYKRNIENQTMWPQMMKSAGYRTFLTGKWHLTTPASELFDEVKSVRAGMPNQTPEGYDRPKEGEVDVWSPWDAKHGGFWSDENGKHWSENQADIAIQYLKDNQQSQEPLFVYVGFNAPHDPRQAPKEFVDMYDPDAIALPQSYMTEHPLMREMGMYYANGDLVRDEALAPFPRTEYSVRRNIQEYYAIITHMDVQIGRLLDELQKSPRYANTLIVFAADNGLGVGKHGLIGKQNMYDHSLKVPLVFAGPNIPKGESREQLVYLQDLVPTIYELLDVQAPESAQFKSLLPSIKSPSVEHRSTIYSAYIDYQRMVRQGDFKLFFIPNAKQVYLFNLKDDPNELNNLYGDPAYDAMVERMAQDYLKVAEQSGDTYDLRAIYPEIFKN